MPTKKSTTKTVKAPAKKRVATSRKAPKKAPVQDVVQEVKMPSVCHACNALPLGSIELVSLLLVVTFSLSAILLTSMFAMDQQEKRIDNLEAQVQYYQIQE